jgi:4-hydroxyphenylacetate 3-monooxygenase
VTQDGSASYDTYNTFLKGAVPMSIRTGQQFIQHLDQLRNCVWIDGSPVEGPISTHPAFAGTIRSKATLYDAQSDPAQIDRMTYASPTTGDRVGLSYLPPRDVKDLAKRREMSREWALLHAGWMGRAPDYTNTALMAFASAAPLFGEKKPVYGERIKTYYQYCREQDLSIAHTFIRPPVDRHRHAAEDANELASLSVIEETADGLVVDGARLMATQGGITDELLIFPSYIPEVFTEERHPLVFAFGIPSNTPGVTFIGRAPYAVSPADAPLSSRYDEIDMIIRFDRVLVPWERVFAYGDVELANRIYDESCFYPHAMHQVLTRLIVKTEFFAALLKRMVGMFELSGWPHVRDHLTEAIVTVETLRALQLASEQGACTNQWGVFTPASAPLYAAIRLYARTYPSMIAGMQRIGASHLIANASEADLGSLHGTWLQETLAAPDGAYDGAAKSRLFRLAWDACSSAFAARQTIYEQFFFGDPQRIADRLVEDTDTTVWEEALERYLHP